MRSTIDRSSNVGPVLRMRCRRTRGEFHFDMKLLMSLASTGGSADMDAIFMEFLASSDERHMSSKVPAISS